MTRSPRVPTYTVQLSPGQKRTEDFYFNTAAGTNDGLVNTIQSGENSNLASNIEATIWPVGGIYNFLTTAQALELVSDSADDNAAGIGAQEVVVTVLDANYVIFEQTVVPNGTTPVAVPGGPYLRCNVMAVTVPGTNRTNVGNIDIQVVGGGQIVNRIPAAEGEDQSSFFTVAAGRTLFLEGWSGSVVSRSAASVTFKLLANIRGVDRLVDRILGFNQGEPNPTRVFRTPLAFPEKTDLFINGTADSNNTDATGSLSGILQL